MWVDVSGVGTALNYFCVSCFHSYQNQKLLLNISSYMFRNVPGICMEKVVVLNLIKGWDPCKGIGIVFKKIKLFLSVLIQIVLSVFQLWTTNQSWLFFS